MSDKNKKIHTTMAASLSEDIFIHILKRLPACSLLRFMLVQKSWYHLIRAPYFRALYSQHHQHDKYILFCSTLGDCISLRVNKKQCNEYSSLPFPRDIINREGFLKLYGTSNGLVCFSYSQSEQIYLWNPVIGKYKTIPDSPTFYDDPLCTRLAFGYLPEINDYRIIKIGKYRTEGEKPRSDIVHVYVYSLNVDHVLDIWILEKEAETKDVWTKKIAIELDDMEETCGFMNNDKLILEKDDSHEYLSYDIEKGPTEDIDDLPDSCSALQVEQPIFVGLLAENLDLLGDN
ncbi:hypothetical protein POM88_053787 [Heracleum sosnowskyi]|uniref:F-box domain-containing protein n=1 Tax=Heracleum sosnowskyi TaxID=360622 RepID=A0AAD8GP62_9APIA|nr:hypothetical protein POM88_053787 [Heracleum sosnowskyi]